MEITTLAGKTALITGGGTGIGFGIAKQFIAAGANVIITGRRAEILKEATETLGENAFYYVHDATDFNSIGRLFDRIKEDIGCIDILVNNAGRHLKVNTLDVSDQAYNEVIQLNLNAVFAFSREFARHAVANKTGGCILMISSMSAMVALDGVVAYASSKAGLEGMVLTLCADLSQYGIRVNAIAPGFIESEMMLNIMEKNPERKSKVMNRILLNRWGTPDDIGKAALYLCSDAASYVTGVILPVDGGMSRSL